MKPLLSLAGVVIAAALIPPAGAQVGQSLERLQVCVRDTQCNDEDRVSVWVNGSALVSGSIGIGATWKCQDALFKPGANEVMLRAENGTGSYSYGCNCKEGEDCSECKVKGPHPVTDADGNFVSGYLGTGCSYENINTSEIRITGQNIQPHTRRHTGPAGTEAKFTLNVPKAGGKTQTAKKQDGPDWDSLGKTPGGEAKQDPLDWNSLGKTAGGEAKQVTLDWENLGKTGGGEKTAAVDWNSLGQSVAKTNQGAADWENLGQDNIRQANRAAPDWSVSQNPDGLRRDLARWNEAEKRRKAEEARLAAIAKAKREREEAERKERERLAAIQREYQRKVAEAERKAKEAERKAKEAEEERLAAIEKERKKNRWKKWVAFGLSAATVYYGVKQAEDAADAAREAANAARQAANAAAANARREAEAARRKAAAAAAAGGITGDPPMYNCRAAPVVNGRLVKPPGADPRCNYDWF